MRTTITITTTTPVNDLAKVARGEKTAIWKVGKKTDPPEKLYPDWGKMYILRVLFPKFPRFLPNFPWFLPNSNHFATFGMEKGQNFRRFAPILVILSVSSHPRARKIGEENRYLWPRGWGRKQDLWPEYWRVLKLVPGSCLIPTKG